MAFEKVSQRTNDHVAVYSCLSADTRDTDGVFAGDICLVDNGDIEKYTGTQWIQTASGGSTNIYGLASSAVRVSSGSYSATEILGFRVLVKGTGTLTLSPVSGATDIVITAAELTAMGVNAFVDWPMHLDSITLGNADMEVLVYIP